MPTLLLFISIFALAFYAASRWQEARAKAQPVTQAPPLDELPDLLESLALCAEAGMDLVLAMGQLVEPRKDEPLAGELYRVVQEVRAGATREEAWRHFAARADDEDVRMLVGALLQAGTLGIPPARALRTQASSMRERRFHLAERRAGQAPVRLLLPMVCIFLSVFVALFGAIFLSFSTGAM